MHRNNPTKYYNFTYDKASQISSKTAAKNLVYPDAWSVGRQSLDDIIVHPTTPHWSASSGSVVQPAKQDITVEEDLQMTGQFASLGDYVQVEDTSDQWTEYILKEATLSHHESPALVRSEADPAHQAQFYRWRQEWYSYVSHVKTILNASEYLKQQITPYFYRTKCRIDDMLLLRVKEFKDSILKSDHKVLRLLLRCTFDSLCLDKKMSTIYTQLYPKGHHIEVTLALIPGHTHPVHLMYVGAPIFECLENGKQSIGNISENLSVKSAEVISQALQHKSTLLCDAASSGSSNSSRTGTNTTASNVLCRDPSEEPLVSSTADNNKSFLYKNNLVLQENSHKSQQLAKSVSALTQLTQECQAQVALTDAQSHFSNIFLSEASSIVPLVPRYEFRTSVHKCTVGRQIDPIVPLGASAVYSAPSIFSIVKVPKNCVLHKIRVQCSETLQMKVHIVSSQGNIHASTKPGTTNANLLVDRTLIEEICHSDLQESYYLVEVMQFTPASATVFSSIFQVRPLWVLQNKENKKRQRHSKDIAKT